MKYGLAEKLWLFFRGYLPGMLGTGSSAVKFWYLPEAPNVVTLEHLMQYRLTAANFGAPFYLMDYRQKLRHNFVGPNQIILMAYGAPIGNQTNPEAAFQYALGLHDEYLSTKNIAFLNKFLYYANYFRSAQSKEGHWYYDFDYFEHKKPWFSGLAQSRGISVMLRAWMHTKNQDYLDSARRAISLFGIRVGDGGYLSTFSRTNSVYFEEYPAYPTAVLNGFMASLMGLWELKEWVDNESAGQLFDEGIKSLEVMLPSFTIPWWTLYDIDPNTPFINVNSPRYHSLILSYIRILNILHPSKALSKYMDIWSIQNRPINQVAALGVKTARKLIYR